MNKLLTTLTVLTMALSASAQHLKAGRDLPAVPVIPLNDQTTNLPNDQQSTCQLIH